MSTISLRGYKVYWDNNKIFFGMNGDAGTTNISGERIHLAVREELTTVTISLNKESAKELRNQLNKFIGE